MTSPPVAARLPARYGGAAVRPLHRALAGSGPGVLLLGAGSYGFLALAARGLPAGEFAALGAAWVVTFAVGAGLLVSLEQEVARRIAAGTPARAMWSGARRTVLGYGAGVAALTVASAPWLLPHLLDRSPALLGALLAAELAQLPAYYRRGVLAGQHRYRRYGESLAADGALRVLWAAVLVPTAAGPAAYLWAIAASSLLGALWARPDGRAARDEPAPASLGGSTLAWTAVATVAAQVLINAGPLVVQATPHVDAALTGRFLTALLVARVPLFAFTALQVVLLPRLAAHLAGADAGAFRREVRRCCVALGAGGLVAVGIFGIAGPDVLAALFGSQYHSGAGLLALLCAAATLFMIATVLAQALLALRRPRAAAIGWLLGCAVFLALLAAPTTLETRIAVALLAGVGTVTAACGAALRTSR